MLVLFEICRRFCLFSIGMDFGGLESGVCERVSGLVVVELIVMGTGFWVALLKRK